MFSGSAGAAGVRAAALACGQFTQAALAPPAPRDDNTHWIERFAAIKQELAAQPHSALFLGDSITERWPAAIWQQNFAARGVLNAGINGDRTEHLLWRLDHGDLAGPRPRLIVVLIGTNDLAHGRPPEIAAEGVRANLSRLREDVPAAHILLLGLTPRSDRFDRGVEPVNRLIARCGGGLVTYADPGKTLRDPGGRVRQGILSDGVHFTAPGYRALAQQLTPLLDRLLAQQ